MKLFVIACLAFPIFFTSQAQDNEFHLNKVYSISLEGKISLKSSDAKVYITGADRNDVHVKIDRIVEYSGFSWGDNDFEVEVQETDGNLDIIERSESTITIVGSMREKYEITIEAPYGVSLEIDGDDDHYYLRKINGAISLDLDDADVELTDCKGKNFEFIIDDGNLSMDQAAGKLSLKSDDADITIKNAQFSEIFADVDDGDLYLETGLSDNGDYEFRGDDSDIELVISSGGGTFQVRHDDGHIRSTSSFIIKEENEGSAVLKLNNGNAKIYINTDDASIRLSTL